MEFTKEEQESIDRAYAELAAWENDVFDHNQNLIESLGDSAKEDFDAMMDCCSITDKIEIVESPDGDNQQEDFGIFSAVYVRQWSTSIEGDSYSGFTYARIPDGRWFKIPYSC